MPSQTQDQSAAAKAKDLQTDTQRLKGKLAVVTGADSGIGQATAIAFAKEGADVVIAVHQDREGAQETRQQVEDAGRRALVVPLEQKDPESVREFFRTIRSELGVPDILFNNAGIGGVGKQVNEMTDDEWDDVIRTDLYGPFYCAREFVRGLRDEEKPGVLLNNTSVHQEIPMKGTGAYDAAKAGLRNLTRTWAVELAPHKVRVVNIAPGMILTPMNQEAIDDPQEREQREKNIPWGRAGEPEEVARAAVFLASDEASYVHGTTLFVDGGLTQNVGQGA